MREVGTRFGGSDLCAEVTGWGLCLPTFDAMRLRQRWGTPFRTGERSERQKLGELQGGVGLFTALDLGEFFADEADHGGGLFGGDAGDEAGLLVSAQSVEPRRA